MRQFLVRQAGEARRCIATLVLFAATVPIAESRADDTAEVTAASLVKQAREAEVEGRTARQFALLREAVRVAPEYSPARWQLGQLKTGDKWLNVEEAQRTAAANPAEQEYRKLRSEVGQNAADHLALARWCRKNDLHEEARFHWSTVLAMQPGNEEALRSLGLRLYQGRPMTPAQIAADKEQARAFKRAFEAWEPKISKWCRILGEKDAAAREAVLAEIRALRAMDALPALESATLSQETAEEKRADGCRQMGLALVDSLREMTAPEATESLVRHAVLAPSQDVRDAATTALKSRPIHQYVPLLLSGLTMPVESSFSVTTDAQGGVHYRHSLYREGAERDWSFDASYAVIQHVLPGKDYAFGRLVRSPLPVNRNPQVASVAQSSRNRFGATAAAVESQVNGANQFGEYLNERIMPVLAATTGKDYVKPKLWWHWWRDNNEYYAYDHPVEHQYYSGTDNRYYGHPYDRNATGMSCFVRGTPVWTKTGPQPIETIDLGELVLAQDVNTGELAYRPVIGRTVRPPSPIVNLTLGGEQILTTRGHLFWVAGQGWRMAKELGDGAVLRGVTGAVRLGGAKEVEPAEAYNLVVADFNTYFVGESGILVHDNTPRWASPPVVAELSAK